MDNAETLQGIINEAAEGAFVRINKCFTDKIVYIDKSLTLIAANNGTFIGTLSVCAPKVTLSHISIAGNIHIGEGSSVVNIIDCAISCKTASVPTVTVDTQSLQNPVEITVKNSSVSNETTAAILFSSGTVNARFENSAIKSPGNFALNNKSLNLIDIMGCRIESSSFSNTPKACSNFTINGSDNVIIASCGTTVTNPVYLTSSNIKSLVNFTDSETSKNNLIELRDTQIVNLVPRIPKDNTIYCDEKMNRVVINSTTRFGFDIRKNNSIKRNVNFNYGK